MTHGVIGLATSKTPEVGSSSSISETCKQDQSSYQADTFGLTAASQVQSMVDMLVREHASIVQALQSEICCLRQQLANAESCASIVDKTKAGEPSFGDGKASVPKSESNEVSVTGADNPIVVGGEPTKASSFGSEFLEFTGASGHVEERYSLDASRQHERKANRKERCVEERDHDQTPQGMVGKLPWSTEICPQ